MAAEKKKASVLDILFGNGSISGNDYRLVHFNTAIVTTKNGDEPTAILVYGNDSGVFTTTAPLAAVMFRTHDDALFPTVKVLKGGFMGAGSKIEITLPRGYSFMPVPASVQMQIVKESVGSDSEDAVSNKRGEPPGKPDLFPTRRNGEFDFEDSSLPSCFGADTDVSDVYDNKSDGADREASVNEEGEHRDSAIDLMIDDMLSDAGDREENGSMEEYEQDMAAKQPKGNVDVIDDGENFLSGFNEEALNDKINKFLERHDKAEKEIAASKSCVEEAKAFENMRQETESDAFERISRAEEAFSD